MHELALTDFWTGTNHPTGGGRNGSRRRSGVELYRQGSDGSRQIGNPGPLYSLRVFATRAIGENAGKGSAAALWRERFGKNSSKWGLLSGAGIRSASPQGRDPSTALRMTKRFAFLKSFDGVETIYAEAFTTGITGEHREIESASSDFINKAFSLCRKPRSEPFIRDCLSIKKPSIILRHH